MGRDILRKAILLSAVIFSLYNQVLAQAPSPGNDAPGAPEIPGGPGNGPAVGAPLDSSDAIYILVGAGIIYLLFHYRHILLKKEA